jgi:hypothetical protein
MAGAQAGLERLKTSWARERLGNLMYCGSDPMMMTGTGDTRKRITSNKEIQEDRGRREVMLMSKPGASP